MLYVMGENNKNKDKSIECRGGGERERKRDGKTAFKRTTQRSGEPEICNSSENSNANAVLRA